jgi:hypothetical protein
VTDFPAAHSMDTTWFAIDADGCVGIFDSDEGGAVPTDLSKVAKNEIEFEGDLLKVLVANDAKFLDRSAVDIDFILHHASLENLLVEIQDQEVLLQELGRSEEFHIWGLFLILSTVTIIPEIQEQADIVLELHRDSDRIIVYIDQCKPQWLKKAIASGAVLAGSREFDLEDNLNLLGWYIYDCGEQYASTYDRKISPKKPILFKDLPAEISDRIRLIKFPNLRFADTNLIQPIEHMSCRTWNGTRGWQGTDGEWHEGFPDYSIPYSERFPDRQ